MTNAKTIDPVVTLEEALKATDGNQAELGRLVGVQRAWINAMVKRQQVHLPPLLAWRFTYRDRDRQAA